MFFRQLDEDDIIEWEGHEYGWILGAAKPVSIDDMLDRDEQVKRIAATHAGFYDGGEATYFTGSGPAPADTSAPDQAPLDPHDTTGPSPSAASENAADATATHDSEPPDASRAFRAPIRGADNPNLRTDTPPSVAPRATAHRRVAP